MTTCMMTSPPARCTLPVGHDGPHATREGYGWHDSDDMGVSVTAALIEKETEQDEGAHIGPEGETDWHGLYLSENRRAEKAERALAEMTAHRDQCRDIATKWQVEANRLRGEQSDPSVDYHAMWWKAEREREEAERERDVARAEQSAAIEPTDEMVRRGSDWAMDNPMHGDGDMRKLLTAALTPEPARPEGAEEIEALIGSWEESDFLMHHLGADDLSSLADHLAARVRVEGQR